MTRQVYGLWHVGAIWLKTPAWRIDRAQNVLYVNCGRFQFSVFRLGNMI